MPARLVKILISRHAEDSGIALHAQLVDLTGVVTVSWDPHMSLDRELGFEGVNNASRPWQSLIIISNPALQMSGLNHAIS